VEEHCLRCHDVGGIGGIELTGYDQALEWRSPLGLAVERRIMPPWRGSRCCAEYLHDWSLEPAEIAAVLAWVDADGPEGDPADYVAPELPAVGLERVDLELSMPEPYLPEPAPGETDINRCFLVDWPEPEVAFVTGLGLVPGNAEIVHHALVLVAAPSVVAGFEAQEELDAAPGWTCPGGIPWGTSSWIGGWSPGWEAREFPGGLGQEVEPGSKLILALHYSLAGTSASEDQTTIQLTIEPEVPGSMETIGLYDPSWLYGGMPIPKGNPDVIYSYQTEPEPRADGEPTRLLAVNLHMHERGSQGQVGIVRADGSIDCLLQVDDYDYDWQYDYLLAEPALLQPGDELFVECHFDNSEGHQRIVAGEREKPKALNWGDDQEMCVAYVTTER